MNDPLETPNTKSQNSGRDRTLKYRNYNFTAGTKPQILTLGLVMVVLACCSGPVGDQENNDLTNIRTFVADQRYLVFPMANGYKGEHKIFIEVDGEMFFSVYDALFAESEPDFWTPIDLSLLQGKEIKVRVEGPNAEGVRLVMTSDTIPGNFPLYQEPGRPQVHFSPIRGWLNDPSGMIYFNGRWHMDYANTRFSNVMAGPNNSWGHAVSTDLLHWEEQPLFLRPVREKHSFWTGGTAIDVANTTVLGTADNPALVIMANNGSEAPNAFTQCVFVSTDEMMTAIMPAEMMYKPLPKEDDRRGGGTRDPMIIWYEPDQKWVMVVHNQEFEGQSDFFFFESADLENWEETSVLRKMHECPNLFELPVDGDLDNKRWVIWGSQTAYRIGSFDGETFTPDPNNPDKYRSHHAFDTTRYPDDILGVHTRQDFSASQVFANGPKGRIIQVGWAHVCDYDGEFSQMASFPLDLSLRTTPEGIRLFTAFIPELSNLRKEGQVEENLLVGPELTFSGGDISMPTELVLEFEPGDATKLTIRGDELDITWDSSNGLSTGFDVIPLKPENGLVRIHVLLDIPSTEITCSSGHYLLQGRDYLKLKPNSPVKISVEGGDMLFHRLEIYPLRSIHTGA